MKVIASWSGGKDSCLSCYKAILSGHEVSFILNFVSKEYKRCCFHGVPVELMKVQSDSVNIPLVQKEVSPSMEEYETEFKSAVTELRDKHGIEGMVFGDVYLEEHNSWVRRVCNDLRIVPIEPLWNISPEKIVNEFINDGFKAIVVSAKADSFTQDFLGREIDDSFVKELKEKNICPCGENGEFHTFVFDGPLFRKRIKVNKTEKILKKGFWEHWFLDIQNYEIEGKHG